MITHLGEKMPACPEGPDGHPFTEITQRGHPEILRTLSWWKWQKNHRECVFCATGDIWRQVIPGRCNVGKIKDYLIPENECQILQWKPEVLNFCPFGSASAPLASSITGVSKHEN